MPLPSLFSGPPPDRSTFVEPHAIPFSPQQWLNRLPEPWMIGALADVQPTGGNRWPEVDRQTLIAAGSRVTTREEAVRFYVMACAWGVGVNQRFVTRRVRVLTDNDDPGARLLAGIRLNQQEGPTTAYASFRDGGANRLKHLGPGFFTKILYFSGWTTSPGPRPLILDQYVANALNDIANLGWRPTWNWTTAQYEQYLGLATGWADEWGTQPDVIEKTLFRHGQRRD